MGFNKRKWTIRPAGARLAPRGGPRRSLFRALSGLKAECADCRISVPIESKSCWPLGARALWELVRTRSRDGRQRYQHRSLRCCSIHTRNKFIELGLRLVFPLKVGRKAKSSRCSPLRWRQITRRPAVAHLGRYLRRVRQRRFSLDLRSLFHPFDAKCFKRVRSGQMRTATSKSHAALCFFPKV
jgi:hypothetical protein